MGSDSSQSRSSGSSLIAGLRAYDDQAWHRFVDLYGPLVYYWCRHCGLSADDVADVAQEVFRGVAAGVNAFRRQGPGDSFRGWLHVITQNKIRDHFRQRVPGADGIGGTDCQRALGQLPAESSAPAVSEDGDGVRDLLDRALQRIRGDFSDQTWAAFQQVVFSRREAADIAAELGMTANGVRKAKARVLQRLREELGEGPE